MYDTLLKYYRAQRAGEEARAASPTTPGAGQASWASTNEQAEQLQRMTRDPLSLEKEVRGTDSKKS